MLEEKVLAYPTCEYLDAGLHQIQVKKQFFSVNPWISVLSIWLSHKRNVLFYNSCSQNLFLLAIPKKSLNREMNEIASGKDLPLRVRKPVDYKKQKLFILLFYNVLFWMCVLVCFPENPLSFKRF